MLHHYKKHTLHEPFQSIRTPVEGSWTHADQPSTDEIDSIVEKYSLDPNIVRDVLDKGELPRSEYSDGNLYVFMRPASRTSHGEVSTSPLLAIVTPSTFITIASTSTVTAGAIIDICAEKDIRTSDTAGMLLLTLMTVTSGYESLVQHTGSYIKGVRRKLQNHEVSNKDFIHFVTIEDNLNEYQYCLQDTLAVVDRLKENAHGLFKPKEVEVLDDTRLYVKQLLNAVASHNQTVNSIRNAYSTIANNTLNQRMKALTMLTVLIALPNVFYGMFGMNVDLPFQDQPWAYLLIVGFSIFVVFCVYALAKRFRVF